MSMKKLVFAFGMLMVCLALVSCAGERQGLVCDEMEYRLNTMTYSPDQRAYAEEELRVCRADEEQKKTEGAATRKSIYDRFAASDTTKSDIQRLADTTDTHNAAIAQDSSNVNSASSGSSVADTVANDSSAVDATVNNDAIAQ